MITKVIIPSLLSSLLSLSSSSSSFFFFFIRSSDVRAACDGVLDEQQLGLTLRQAGNACRNTYRISVATTR